MPVEKNDSEKSNSEKSNSKKSSVWWDFFVTNRFLLPAFAILLFSTAVPLIYVYGSKESAIDAKLKSGVIPDAVLKTAVQVHRSHGDLKQLITNSFLTQRPQTHMFGFGLILGPTGTGKTYLTRLACRDFKNPTGVLYHEIADPSFFPERLAKTIGMKLADDTNILDILLEKVGVSSWINFYRLPQNLSMALSYVLDTLAKRGAEHQRQYNRTPCLFIDGADLLAKKYPEVFLTLVDLAKHYANNAMLRIILVGRENQILPLLDRTSLRLQARTIEVADIGREDTLNYLKQNGLSESAAEKVANLTGGRFSLLNKAIEIYVDKKKTIDEKSVFEHVRSYLVNLCYQQKVQSGSDRVLLHYVWQSPIFWPGMLEVINNPEVTTEELMHSLNSLINHDVLRYTVDGIIEWHNEVVHYGFNHFMNTVKIHDEHIKRTNN